MRILAFLAALTLAASVSAQTAADVTAKYNEAGAALQARDYEKSAALFDETIQMGAVVGEEAQTMVINAQNFLVQSLIRVGMAAATAQDFPKSIDFLTRARDRAELYGNAQLMRTAVQSLGQVYFASGADAYNNERYDEAITIFADGFAADETNTDMGLNLARSYDKIDNLEKALETYQAIIALEGRHSRYAEAVATAKEELGLAILDRANKAIAAGNTAQAAELMIAHGEVAAEALADETLKSNAYYLLGTAFHQTGDTAKAIEAFRKVTAGPSAAQARTLVNELSR